MTNHRCISLMSREEIEDELRRLRAMTASRQRLFRHPTRDRGLHDRMHDLRIALAQRAHKKDCVP